MGPITAFFFASQEGDPGTESGMTSTVHCQSGMTKKIPLSFIPERQQPSFILET
jgi:hypothetical protein